MANLTVDSSKVRIVESIEQCNAVVTEGYEAGQVLGADGTTGKYSLVNASASAPVLPGVAVNSDSAGYRAVTIIRQGIVWLGDALDSLDYGDPVYLSDTDGTLADAAGTTSVEIGVVTALHDMGSVSKALRVQL